MTAGWVRGGAADAEWTAMCGEGVGDRGLEGGSEGGMGMGRCRRRSEQGAKRKGRGTERMWAGGLGAAREGTGHGGGGSTGRGGMVDRAWGRGVSPMTGAPEGPRRGSSASPPSGLCCRSARLNLPPRQAQPGLCPASCSAGQLRLPPSPHPPHPLQRPDVGGMRREARRGGAPGDVGGDVGGTWEGTWEEMIGREGLRGRAGGEEEGRRGRGACGRRGRGPACLGRPHRPA